MIALIFAVLFTLGVSALCSVLEAMFLSTTTADIEMLKKRYPRRGAVLEKLCNQVEETTSALLTWNTVANTAGASMSGALALTAIGEKNIALFSAVLVVGILFFAEIKKKKSSK